MAKGSRIGLVAVAAGLALALGAVAKRLAADRGGGALAGPEPYRCDCGTVYLVHGADRHRVYWHGGEAVLGDHCVSCDAPLPSGHDTTVV